MALSWMGLAFIPLCVTIKPRILPELTPNAHFKGLSFMLCLHNSSKVSYRCLLRSGRSLGFTSISLYKPPWIYLSVVRISWSPSFDKLPSRFSG